MVTQQRVPRARARRLSPDERRQALLREATELFIEHGAAFTTADLAAAAGVSEGTIFRYFPDKASLVAAAKLGALDLDSLLEMIDAAVTLPVLRERLIVVASVLRPRIERMARVMERSSDPHGPPDDVVIADLVSAVARLFDEPTSDAAPSPEQLANVFLGALVFNGVLAPRAGLPSMDVDQLVTVLLEGVGDGRR